MDAATFPLTKRTGRETHVCDDEDGGGDGTKKKKLLLLTTTHKKEMDLSSRCREKQTAVQHS